jgi:hypothetical protein
MMKALKWTNNPGDKEKKLISNFGFSNLLKILKINFEVKETLVIIIKYQGHLVVPLEKNEIKPLLDRIKYVGSMVHCKISKG